MKILKNYSKKQKKLRRKLLRSILLLLIFFGSNTYAWFIFFNKFDGSVDANIIAWDVSFYDEETDMDNISIEIENLQPGMPEYTKTVYINNSSDVKANLTYSIQSLKLFGVEYDSEEYDLTKIVASYFPFEMDFQMSKDVLLSGGDSAEFTLGVKWNFESENKYYKLNELYEYSDSVLYYNINEELDESVNKDNFLDKVQKGLYIESDDGDSYWGKKAYRFKQLNPDESCLSMMLKLTVEQIKSED